MKLEHSPRDCRIVCTLGPASWSPEVLERMVRAGMDVARLNFSHGTHADHRRTVEALREIARAQGREVAVLQDLQGHKVRVGHVEDGESVSLEAGAEIRLGPGPAVTSDRIGVDYERLAESVPTGQHVYLDDGLLDLMVLSVDGEDLVCRVEIGGPLRSRKGVIFPDARLEFPLINDKDLEDARFGVELNADMVAMSFVRGPEEVTALRARLREWGCADPFIVAKIEEREGIENLDGILDAVQAVLIARGDMGVSLPREKVPGIQKQILRRANARGVPVITATQMLESMTHASRPTRAEVSDVHNAVLDGTDAVMLSGETATGRYPVRALQEMDRICRAAEAESRAGWRALSVESPEGLRDKIAEAAAVLVRSVGARCIVGFSLSGSTLRALSSARCPVPVYGVVADPAVVRRLALCHGLNVVTMPVHERLGELATKMVDRLRGEGVVQAGDRVVAVAGRLGPDDRENQIINLFEIEPPTA